MSSSEEKKIKKYCRFSYSKEALQDAINSVRIDGMSINKASQQYKIPIYCKYYRNWKQNSFQSDHKRKKH